VLLMLRVLLMLPTRKLAHESGFLQLRPTLIHEDNVSAKQLPESGNFKAHSKHFELRWRFLRHCINRGIVSKKRSNAICNSLIMLLLLAVILECKASVP
jgi:hypothetical protein